MSAKQPLVHYHDQTPPLSCPYGEVRRIVTGGAGGIANVHVVRVSRGSAHLHQGYDEVYYVLAGSGQLRIDNCQYELRPGAVAVIPAGALHSLQASADSDLEFIIFGTPPLSLDDPQARPIAPE